MAGILSQTAFPLKSENLTFSSIMRDQNWDIQSTDFKGPTIFICYWRISIIVNIETKEKHFKGLKNGIRFRQISVTGGSVRAGFNCTLKCFFLKVKMMKEFKNENST